MSEPVASRREEIAGELAEWLHSAAREAQARLMAAEDTDEFVKLTGSLCKLARGVRHCLALHERFEKLRLAGEDEADARRGEAVQARKRQIAGAVGRRLEREWPETEDLDDNERFNEELALINER